MFTRLTIAVEAADFFVGSAPAEFHPVCRRLGVFPDLVAAFLVVARYFPKSGEIHYIFVV
ncbi:MAG TPA: hypothetical protein VF449_05685 [Parvibaculum sp.]